MHSPFLSRGCRIWLLVAQATHTLPWPWAGNGAPEHHLRCSGFRSEVCRASAQREEFTGSCSQEGVRRRQQGRLCTQSLAPVSPSFPSLFLLALSPSLLSLFSLLLALPLTTTIVAVIVVVHSFFAAWQASRRRLPLRQPPRLHGCSLLSFFFFSLVFLPVGMSDSDDDGGPELRFTEADRAQGIVGLQDRLRCLAATKADGFRGQEF